MKFKIYFLILFSIISIQTFGQKKNKKIASSANYPAKIDRPKLVVGIVIDQMRWDYLYRFYNRYSNGGFKRLINDGFSVENTFIPYVPTYTAVGHTCIYTGSVPAITGIIGNDWYDKTLGRNVYCAEDRDVKTVGSTTRAGEMSPKNNLVTTITDELRLATNFRSKVIGISEKDRGAILPAGHTANAAYWYDGGSGNWITSTHYMQQLPTWVRDYNAKKVYNDYYKNDWKTLYPINTYVESTADDKPYEGKFRGEKSSTFQKGRKKEREKNEDMIRSTPFGNTMTFDISKKAIEAEKLGQTGNTDFLAISCSSTDYVGHQFGPNSIELEDTYLRLDKDMADFFTYLDQKLGKDNYLVFLSADHAVSHVPGFEKENKIPGGTSSSSRLRKGIDSVLVNNFDLQKAVITTSNNQVYLDQKVIADKKEDFTKIKQVVVDFLRKQDGVANAVDIEAVSGATIPKIVKERITNGFNPQRSGDVYYFLKSGYIDGGSTGTTHGAWYAYDAHIPLVFMGWKVKPGKTNQTHYMTDISATLAAMLHIQMPSGCVGTPITEITH